MSERANGVFLAALIAVASFHATSASAAPGLHWLCQSAVSAADAADDRPPEASHGVWYTAGTVQGYAARRPDKSVPPQQYARPSGVSPQVWK